MKHIHFDVESDGFYGAYWACKDGSDCTVIAMLGDDPEDYMARSAVKWLLRLGVNILTMSPAKKDYGHHNYPLERIEKAIAYLKSHGNAKIGIAGASTTGTLALTAASLFDDISLTIAMTPSDFVWQGFLQGKKDGCKEWPIEGESLFSYKGKPLPYILAFVFSVLIYLLLFAITFLVEAVLHLEALSVGLVLENLKIYFLDGVGVFFAISPIIALVARMKKGYWLALVFAEIYSFAGLFASMSQQLKTVYPMTAVFNISGYYNANMFQVLIGVVILMVCVILSLLILKGLNRKTK